MLEVSRSPTSTAITLDKEFSNISRAMMLSAPSKNWTVGICVDGPSVSHWTIIEVVRTTIAVTTGATNALATIETGKTAIERTVLITAVTALDRLLVVLNMKIVAPGLRPPGGRLMTEGLQGTILTDAEMTEDATIRTNGSTIGLQGTQTEMAGGHVEVVSGRWPDEKKRMAVILVSFLVLVGLPPKWRCFMRSVYLLDGQCS